MQARDVLPSAICIARDVCQVDGRESHYAQSLRGCDATRRNTTPGDALKTVISSIVSESLTSLLHFALSMPPVAFHFRPVVPG